MKKVLIFLMLILPIWVKAETSANATGDKVNLGGSSSGGGTVTASCAYFFQNDYGIRVTFYSQNGTKIGKSVDVFAGSKKPAFNKVVLKKTNASGKTENLFSVISSSKTQWKHAPYASNGGMKSRIDYINSGMKSFNPVYEYGCTTNDYNCLSNNNYYVIKQYYDLKSSTYNKTKGDPLLYLNYSGREYLKEYFTRTETILNYASLAGASIDVESIKDGEYFLLIEPLFHLEVLSTCNSRKQAGYYTSTELGILNRSDSSILNRYKALPGKQALRLFADQSISKYSFVTEEAKIQVNKNYVPEPSTLINKVSGTNSYYGYGMMIVKGTEVQGYSGGTKRFQIIYRTIDLTSPFLNIDGTKRTLSEDSNWSGNESTIDQNIYSKSPFLTVVLDPVSIQKIREENKTIDYSKLTIQTYNTFRNNYPEIFK